MVILFYILDIYNMANDLKHISHILEEVWKDLEELNKRFDEREKVNGRVNVLPSSDARITRNRNKTTGDEK